jgi:hypothetical protein
MRGTMKVPVPCGTAVDRQATRAPQFEKNRSRPLHSHRSDKQFVRWQVCKIIRDTGNYSRKRCEVVP